MRQRGIVRPFGPAIAIVGVVLAWVIAGQAAPPDALLDVGLIGHRGFTAQHPENSLDAVKAAIDLGIYGAEIDIRTTRDGEYVLSHDPTLERMTTGKGVVASMTLAEIRDVTMRDRPSGSPSQRRVPTLDEVFALVRQHPAFQLTLDMKAVDPASLSRRVVAAGMAKQVTFFTGGVTDVAAAKAVKAVDPSLRIAVDVNTWWRLEGVPTFVAEALDADVLFAAEWNFPKYGFDEGRATGRRVHVFISGTENLRERLQKAAALGAQAVSSDRPDQLVDLVVRQPIAGSRSR